MISTHQNQCNPSMGLSMLFIRTPWSAIARVLMWNKLMRVMLYKKRTVKRYQASHMWPSIGFYFNRITHVSNSNIKRCL